MRAAAEEPCRLLNRYYTPLKYPSHFPPLKRKQACEAVTAALEVERLVVEAIGEGLVSEDPGRT